MLGLDRATASCSEPLKVNFVDSEGKSRWVGGHQIAGRPRPEGVNNKPR